MANDQEIEKVGIIIDYDPGKNQYSIGHTKEKEGPYSEKDFWERISDMFYSKNWRSLVHIYGLNVWHKIEFTKEAEKALNLGQRRTIDDLVDLLDHMLLFERKLHKIREATNLNEEVGAV